MPIVAADAHLMLADRVRPRRSSSSARSSVRRLAEAPRRPVKPENDRFGTPQFSGSVAAAPGYLMPAAAADVLDARERVGRSATSRASG